MIDSSLRTFLASQTPLVLPGGERMCRVCCGQWADPVNDGLCGCWQMETFLLMEAGEGWVVKNESDSHIFHLRDFWDRAEAAQMAVEICTITDKAASLEYQTETQGERNHDA